MDIIIYIFLVIILVLILVILRFYSKEKYEYTNIIGFNVMPIWGVNLYSRIANVPLTPFQSRYAINKNIELPKFFCYKTSILSDIINQGLCGCCWCIVVCNILSSRAYILTNGDVDTTVSVQQLLSCYGNKKGCLGGSPEKVSNWLENTQIRLTSDDKYKYEQYSSKNINTLCITTNKGLRIKKNSVKTITHFIPETNYNQTTLYNNIKNMKSELLLNGPFYSAITTHTNFLTFSGQGIYNNKQGNIIGGHAIQIIGYCDKNIDKRPGYTDAYWICRNSWGSNWPLEIKDKGYFAMPMGKNFCGIESRCGSFLPDVPINSPDVYKLAFTNFSDFSEHLAGNLKTN
jgi:cathepsin B